MNKETDMIDVCYFIREFATLEDIHTISNRVEIKRLELQGKKYAGIKLKSARDHFRNKTKVENAEEMYTRPIVEELIKEGFIYKEGDIYRKCV